MEKLELNREYQIFFNTGQFTGILIKEDANSVTLRLTSFIRNGQTMFIYKESIEAIRKR